MSEEAIRGNSEAPEAGNSEALKGLVRSWTEKVKSKCMEEGARGSGELCENVVWVRGGWSGRKVCLVTDGKALGFEMLSPSW